jgi:Rod binding domain-containing protein
MTVDFDINTKSDTKAVTNAKSNNFSAKDKEKLKNAAYEFQALLLNQMLKSMRNTELKDDKSEEGLGADMYSDLFDMNISQSISRTGHFGVAEMLYKKLTGEDIGNSTVMPKTNIETSVPLINKAQPIQTNTVQPSGNVDEIYSKVSQYNGLVNSASKEYQVEPGLIKAIIAVESGGNKLATSKTSAKGLMQLMDDTAQDMGVNDSFNPHQNIQGGTKYISEMLNKYDGDLSLALAAYNAGPGAVDKFNGVPPYKETKNYINSVTKYLNMFKLKDQELTSNE